MAYTDIDKPSDYFNTSLWTGNGGTQSITGVGFQPDWVWIKSRTGTYSGSDHHIYDVIRGANAKLSSNSTGGSATISDTLTSFDSDGYSLGFRTRVNGTGTTYAGWNWLAGGTASSNSDGSITSNVSANTTSGFSIVQWTGTQANGTIGHGLGVAPSMIIVKANAVKDWMVGHDGIGWTKYINLNTTSAASTASTVWQDTAPTSSVFSVGSSSDVNTSSTSMIAYCFAEKKGFSKFGSYTGNGSTNGTFVYTGFKPAFVMIKRTDASSLWTMKDNKRNTYNPQDSELAANTSDAENTPSAALDFYSTGFKLKGNFGNINISGSPYIYICFAENPFTTSTGIPTTAR
jgi:hypothetical protein